jgi:hypothetical protein
MIFERLWPFPGTMGMRLVERRTHWLLGIDGLGRHITLPE